MNEREIFSRKLYKLKIHTYTIKQCSEKTIIFFTSHSVERFNHLALKIDIPFNATYKSSE